MNHVPAARPCSANDLFLVAGGLQCGNCLASTVKPLQNHCSASASDGPCPLVAEDGDTLCWVHAAAQSTQQMLNGEEL